MQARSSHLLWIWVGWFFLRLRWRFKEVGSFQNESVWLFNLYLLRRNIAYLGAIRVRWLLLNGSRRVLRCLCVMAHVSIETLGRSKIQQESKFQEDWLIDLKCSLQSTAHGRCEDKSFWEGSKVKLFDHKNPISKFHNAFSDETQALYVQTDLISHNEPLLFPNTDRCLLID